MYKQTLQLKGFLGQCKRGREKKETACNCLFRQPALRSSFGLVCRSWSVHYIRKKEKSTPLSVMTGASVLERQPGVHYIMLVAFYSKLLVRDFIRSSEMSFSRCSISAKVSSNNCRANSYTVPKGITLLCSSGCAPPELPPAKDLMLARVAVA